MLKRLDRSPFLLRILAHLNEFLAKRRGLPVVVGVFLVIVGFAFQLVDVYVEDTVVALVSVITHNLGVLIALIGLLLANPLGK